jgi:hypothetical protein
MTQAGTPGAEVGGCDHGTCGGKRAARPRSSSGRLDGLTHDRPHGGYAPYGQDRALNNAKQIRDFTPTPITILRGLRKALQDMEPEITLALKVGVIQAAGYRRSEIAQRLDVPAHALRAAEARVKRAAPRLDQGDA